MKADTANNVGGTKSREEAVVHVLRCIWGEVGQDSYGTERNGRHWVGDGMDFKKAGFCLFALTQGLL